MTISTSTNSVVYIGNGATTEFAVPFKVLSEDHLQVRRRVLATGVYEHTYVGTDYSYSGIGASSGTLTLDGDPLEEEFELVIERIVPYTQDLDIVNSGGFYPETVEEQLDFMVMVSQQLANIAERSLAIPVGEEGLTSLPIRSLRIGKFHVYDADGNPAVSEGSGGGDTALRVDLGVDTGAMLVGTLNGISVQTRLTQIEGTITSGRLAYETYADLAANVSSPAGTVAEVPITDLGTHTDPVVGGTVDNTGIFRWSASPAGWERLYDVDAASVIPYRDETAVLAAEAAASEAVATAAAATVEDLRLASAIAGQYPYGWLDPLDYTEAAWYRDDYGVKYWSNTYRIYTMMPYGGSTRSDWHSDAGIFEVLPDDGLLYVAVDMEKVYDPTLQGTVATEAHVNFVTGNDTTGDGSAGLPYKTVTGAAGAIVKVNAGGDDVYDIIVHVDGAFIGNSCMNPLDKTISKKVRIRNANPEKWWMPGVRETDTAALWAFADIGDGVFVGDGGVATAAKNTPIVFDLSVLDSDGAPTPSHFVAGTFATAADAKTAILATGRPGFHYNAAYGLVVQLASGASPVPGVNFGYAELAGTNIFSVAETCRARVTGFKCIKGTATALQNGFGARPLTFTIGSSAPNVQHDIAVCFDNCTMVGVSGNGFDGDSCFRFLVINCRDFYCWLDGVNETSLYLYPSSSNSTDQGLYDHCFVDRHISKYHNANGQKSAPAVNASANCFTGHARGRSTVINSIGVSSNGSSVAYVGGARMLSMGNLISSPKTVTPATDTYTACFLASGIDNGLIEGSRIFSMFDQGYARGPDSATHYAGASSRVAVVGFRSEITAVEVSDGQVVDGSGADL